MRSLLAIVGCLVSIAASSVVSFAAEASKEAPLFVWNPDSDRNAEDKVTLNRRFAIDRPPVKATLRAVGDFAAFSIWINGTLVAQREPYDPPFEIEIANQLQTTNNEIVVRAQGVPGPSAIALTLAWTNSDGESQSLVTDASWTTESGNQVTTYGPVETHRFSLNRLSDVPPFAEYNQWKEALGASGIDSLSSLPSGFEVKKIRDATSDEDSWVSMTFDPQGRIIVAKETQGLLRLTLDEARDRVVHVEVVDDSLKECRGLVWHNDALFAHANYSKALYRLCDTDGNNTFDSVEKLIETVGGTGHGRNDLTIGPDGALYSIVGDDIDVPTQSPRRAPPEPDHSRELGHLVRIASQDGNWTWEALNRGLRNPYGVAFNRDGEAFTYDADNEGDIGLPLYRPTRINHLVSGANYGWHQANANRDNFPVYAPDTWPTTLDTGRGSPTSVEFGHTSHFPYPWCDAMFALDWAYGRILAVHLTPNGASYHATGEVFLEGRPLNVTDLSFDDQGAMWFITGGRKTSSALYRVRYLAEKHSVIQSAPATEQSAARVAFSSQSRALRRHLEAFHGPSSLSQQAFDDVWTNLASTDPWIRGAARVALEWQPASRWREKALSSSPDLRGLTAMLALSRVGTDEDRQSLSKKLATARLERPTRTETLTYLRILERVGVEPFQDVRETVASYLVSLASEHSEPVNREIARQLAAIDSTHAVGFCNKRLAIVNDQLDRMHYLERLSQTRVGWTDQTRRAFFTALTFAKQLSDGDRILPDFFQQLESAALENIEDPQLRAELAALLTSQLATPVATAKDRPFVRSWTKDELAEPVRELGKGSPTLSESQVELGREIFVAAQCANCHVCGSEGRPMGPDLSAVASRFARAALVESIVEPSSVIAEAYRHVNVLRVDGTILNGRVVQNDFRESKLVLATNPMSPSERQTISKSDIESWSESPVSPMPTQLLDTFTRDEIEALIAYLFAKKP